MTRSGKIRASSLSVKPPLLGEGVQANTFLEHSNHRGGRDARGPSPGFWPRQIVARLAAPRSRCPLSQDLPPQIAGTTSVLEQNPRCQDFKRPQTQALALGPDLPVAEVGEMLAVPVPAFGRRFCCVDPASLHGRGRPCYFARSRFGFVEASLLPWLRLIFVPDAFRVGTSFGALPSGARYGEPRHFLPPLVRHYFF